MHVDISVAFMPADVAEEIIVRCPRDVVSGPLGTGFWRMKKALNGTRKASQSFQECCAGILIKWGFTRNPHNPSMYFHWELDINLEIHGDDFLIDAKGNAF